MKIPMLEINIPLFIIREGKAFVAYKPALDLSTAGKTRKEAEKRFSQAVQIFFEETIKRGTLASALLDLGWQKTNRVWMPPIVVSNEMKSLTLHA